ncbi:MAG: DUF4433 domain-containing protein [Bacteroidia bacterium]|nr:DUF4433 domain-containing protein [Bacteroidia bacterium]
MAIPNPLYLFRMTHVQNVPHALEHGLWTAASPNANPGYIPIGDSEIIHARKAMPIHVPSGGTLSDYIPFYFGARSPMLYIIKKGFHFVKKIPQSEIVYLVVPFENVKNSGVEWCFTDGNARDYSSRHFSEETQLEELDWEVINSQDWKNREDDMDRKRRKQAEFLVKEHVPAACISHIIVYDENTAKFVQGHVDNLRMTIRVGVSPNNKHYY